MGYYHRTAIYLTENQKKVINQYMPQKMSAMVRDIIDVIINSDMINPSDYDNNPELLALLYNYRRELVLANATYINRERIRSHLYDFLNDNHLPLICARYGHKTAIKISRELIEKFRDTYPEDYLSDRVSEDMIIDYVNMIENTGLDDKAWERYQNSPGYKNLYVRERVQ